MQLPSLPIFDIVEEVKSRLAEGAAVLAAPPGSGKTTIVPLILMDEPWLAGRKILLLEPRRLAARAAAARMAALLGEDIGQRVGYQIRFDRRVSPATRIEVVTEGILTRRLQHDPELTGVGVVIFDEFHERSIHADLALALCLDIRQLRDDLRLLVMSATLETDSIAQLMGNAAVIKGRGSSHAVAVDYLQRKMSAKISEVVTSGIYRVLQEQQGDILAFLPGQGEIKAVAKELADDPELADIVISPLYGNLRQKEQDRVILPDSSGRRRVILATSIAETSLTIEGITCVVDSGWSRRPAFDPGSGLTRLMTVRASRAAAKQRAGRAGRLGPGYCLRLWTKEQHHSLIPFHPPEIVSADLAALALELALWGVHDPAQLCWLDPPRPGAFEQARRLLLSLGAVSASGSVTRKGRELAALPIHPRLAHMLIMARKKGVGSLACDIAAIISERDILRGSKTPQSAELRLRLEILGLWRNRGAPAAAAEGGDPITCRRVDRESRRWRKCINANNGGGRADLDEAGNLLVYAYPDRIARRRAGSRHKYLLAGGRGALLQPADPLGASDYLVVPELDGGKRDARIFLAEPLDIEEIHSAHSELLSRKRLVFWDEQTARVTAVERSCLGAIIVEEKNLQDADENEITEAMCRGVRQMGLGVLPWSRASRHLRSRVNYLRAWQLEPDLPDLSEKALGKDLSWLEPYISGMHRKEDLSRLNMLEIIQSMLGWQNQQRVEQEAPETIRVPSGSNIRLQYQENDPPILAVRLQEVFGLAATPTICRGRVAVLLHLLSPAQRPVQVTADLAGFWENVYPEVKKELKGRYPKHFWPDDPLAAQAVRGVKPKKKKE